MALFRVVVTAKDQTAATDLVRKYKLTVARHSVERLRRGFRVSAHATLTQIRTLEARGYKVRQYENVDAMGKLRQAEVRAAFISALPPSAVSAARQMCSRLKMRSPDTPVLVGVWQHRASVEELGKRLQSSRPDRIVTSLRSAVEQLEAMVRGVHAEPPRAATVASVAPTTETPGQDEDNGPRLTTNPTA